ncbi:MAG TPA: M14 family metallopeptidase [Candidatus Nanopelagicales bacterium]|jgi:protein MpaA
MRRRLSSAITVLTVASSLALTSVAAAPADASVPAARASAAAAAVKVLATPPPRYAAVPPAGISCWGVAKSPVTLACKIGVSLQGRPIIAARQGKASAPRVLVVSGQMHGEEWPGPLVVDRIRRLTISPASTAQIWTVRTMNPDGGARGHRFNARGVDLNGNFPNNWIHQPRGPRYAGTRPLSEPESAAMARFLTWIQPTLIISLHGFSQMVDTTGGGLRAARARAFSQLANIGPAHPVPCGGPCHGNMTDWYTATSRVHGVAFTVEMPHSSLVPRACNVPGHRKRIPVVDCAAYAAYYLAERL